MRIRRRFPSPDTNLVPASRTGALRPDAGDPQTQKEYDVAVTAVNALADEVGDNPKNARYRFIDTLSLLIEAYDEEHYPMPEVSRIELLKFLMEQHGLKQGDLPEIGTQGVIGDSSGFHCFFQSSRSHSSRVRISDVNDLPVEMDGRDQPILADTCDPYVEDILTLLFDGHIVHAPEGLLELREIGKEALFRRKKRII